MSQINRLWTKNFTIITLGSVVSMFGSAVSNFALGLIIYEKTNSPFLYSLFFVAVMIPSVVIPMIAGPFVDRFSRRKIIYSLDFVFFIIFSFASVIAYFNYFNYFLYLAIGVIAGVISSIYNVAYDSFYPMLISEGNFSKAYSIGSLLYPLANTIMVPIAAVVYGKFGLFPLFFVDALSFLVAAICETQIKVDESQTKRNEIETFNFKNELKEGISYLKEEKGLLSVTKYFTVTMFVAGIVQTLLLPFFKSVPNLGNTKYSIVMSSQTAGRIVGGLMHYKIVYPKEQKYRIAVFVYVIISVLDCVFFFSPYKIMILIYFIYGILGVTSYNIRISATQSYVPNEKRGRFNGIFSVFTMLGMVIGELLGGILGEFIFIPYIILGASTLNIICVYLFVIQNKSSIKLLYNREV